MSKLLEGYDIEWVHMAYTLIELNLNFGPRKKEQRSWTVPECLLLKLELPIKSSGTLLVPLKGWGRFTPYLRFNSTIGFIFEELSLD